MYYEERIINGVLSWRDTPDGQWTPFTAKQLKTMNGKKIVTVQLECTVHYQETSGTYGDDADGNRGIVEVERIPLRVEVHTVVPKGVEQWAKAAALDQFEAEERDGT